MPDAFTIKLTKAFKAPQTLWFEVTLESYHHRLTLIFSRIISLKKNTPNIMDSSKEEDPEIMYTLKKKKLSNTWCIIKNKERYSLLQTIRQGKVLKTTLKKKNLMVSKTWYETCSAELFLAATNKIITANMQNG